MNAAERENVCRSHRNGAACEHFRNPGCAKIRCCGDPDKHDPGKWRAMLHDPSPQWCSLGLWKAGADYAPPQIVDDSTIVKIGEGQLATMKL